MQRIYPLPAQLASLDELYGSRRQRIDDRPWVGICMIASLDGATVVDGRSGGLSNTNDTSVLLRLREAADAIVVGAGTVRHESYGPPRKAGQRIGVVTSTGHVDLTTSLFTSGAGFLIMPEDGPPAPRDPAGPIDTLRAGHGRVDLGDALRRLGTIIDQPTFVHVEGGPRLNGSLLDADCVDELNLTLSPVLAGGDGPRAVVGAAATLDRFTLAHVAIDDGSLAYTRWLRRRDE